MFRPVQQYQRGGANNSQKLMQQIAQMLQQQIPPEQIMQQLQKMGVQPQQAQQMIQVVAQQMQQQASPQQGQPQQGQPQMQQGGDFDVDNTNPYLSDNDGDNQMMKGGSHKMPNGMMMKNSMMQSGGKINYADFTPQRTIEKREELYKGANPDFIVYQDTYGDGRKDVTYQNRKTGQLMTNPWKTDMNKVVDPMATGSLDINKSMFKPVQSISKMKKGGMKKWSY